MEEFEIFRYKRPSQNANEVTIQQDGRAITFIEATFQKLGTPNEIQLVYGLNKRIIGMLSDDEQLKDPIPVCKQGKRYSISTRAFFHEHNIEISEARCYELTFINDGFVAIDPYGPFTYAFTVPRQALKPPCDKFMEVAYKAMQEAKRRGTKAEAAIEMVKRIFFSQEASGM